VNEQGLQVKTIVAAIASQEDEARLRTILAFPEWNVHAVQNLPGLNAAVKACSCCVVITDTRLSDGRSWKDVLDHLVGFWNRPQLIVADRLADEALWAEVLNLGAYDLLVTPFEPTEVQRVVTVAWEFCVREAVRARDRALRKTHVTRSSPGAIKGFAVST
jgi:DNA-binding NtrC family response regulator